MKTARAGPPAGPLSPALAGQLQPGPPPRFVSSRRPPHLSCLEGHVAARGFPLGHSGAQRRQRPSSGGGRLKAAVCREEGAGGCGLARDWIRRCVRGSGLERPTLEPPGCPGTSSHTSRGSSHLSPAPKPLSSRGPVLVPTCVSICTSTPPAPAPQAPQVRNGAHFLPTREATQSAGHLGEVGLRPPFSVPPPAGQ